jgi:hypothetical protein
MSSSFPADTRFVRQFIADGIKASNEQIVVAFVTLQLFVLIYLQRFAFFPNSFPLSVPMLALLGGLGWMVLAQRLTFADPRRMAVYMIFVAACLFSQAIAGGSIPSLLQVVILYGCLTVSVTVSEETYRRILDRFVKLMIVPAVIMVVQFAYQKITGQGDPISMNKLVPQSMLLQGYFYEAHYPWYSNFSRPNGYFLLEPSFASAFAATAAIIEITYLRRPYLIMLMLTATCLSMGATGISMLFIAAPFLLVREKWSVAVSVVTGAAMLLLTLYMVNGSLHLLSREGELQTDSSSGSERLLQPAERLVELAFDPAYFFSGDGAGTVIQKVAVTANGTPATGRAVMNPWPMVKVLDEFGLLAMIAYLALYGISIAGNFNVPLKIALSVEFLLTGGYLVSPAMMGLLVLLFFVVTPAKVPKGEVGYA